MEYENILYEKKDRIAKITLNQPRMLNPLSLKTVTEVQDAIKRVEEDDEVRVVIITGAGRAFSAGGEMKGLEEITRTNPGVVQERLRKVHHSVVEMKRLEKPIIAMINGLAYGAGLDFTLGCDLRIASTEARFCEAYLKVGVSPGMGTLYLMPRYIGLGRALNLILTSKEIDANEAERIGLVDMVVPPDKLEETTMEYANTFASGPAKAIAVVKRALLRGLSSDFEQEQAWTAYEQAIQFATRDAREGINAFMEKRKPVFTGEHE